MTCYTTRIDLMKAIALILGLMFATLGLMENL
jgi:hypothetical protein